MSKQALYDEVSHEWDEQVRYKGHPDFPDCWVFTIGDFYISKYTTQDKDVLKILLRQIKDACIRSNDGHTFYYIIKQTVLENILENFYLEAEEVQ